MALGVTLAIKDEYVANALPNEWWSGNLAGKDRVRVGVSSELHPLSNLSVGCGASAIGHRWQPTAARCRYRQAQVVYASFAPLISLMNSALVSNRPSCFVNCSIAST